MLSFVSFLNIFSVLRTQSRGITLSCFVRFLYFLFWARVLLSSLSCLSRVQSGNPPASSSGASGTLPHSASQGFQIFFVSIKPQTRLLLRLVGIPTNHILILFFLVWFVKNIGCLTEFSTFSLWQIVLFQCNLMCASLLLSRKSQLWWQAY